VEASEEDSLQIDAARGTTAGARRFPSRRTLWHTVGLLLALVIAWLVFHAYRQPDFVIDLMNFSLC
jgi:hypothetical protein